MDDDRDKRSSRHGSADAASLSQRCGRCGAENEADAAFCAACHALLAAYAAPLGAEPAEFGAALDGPIEPQEAPPPNVVVEAPPPAEPAAEDDGHDHPIPAERRADAVAAIPDAPPDDEARVPAWFDLPRLDGEEPPAVAVETEPVAPVVGEQDVVSETGEFDIALTDDASEIVPVQAVADKVTITLPDDPMAPIPVVAAVVRREAAVPALVEPFDRPEIVPTGPRKPGRLARTSAATLLLFGAVLALGSFGLIAAAGLNDSVGVVGIAGLALGAVALYVLAVGLVQVLLGRGGPSG